MSEFVEQCDVLIRGGQVIDGTGQPARLADVAITGDRIVALGALNVERAEHVIEATGQTVAPGFIDVHTHDDRLVMSNPEVTPKLSQGVTTVVVGNCGISLSPWTGGYTPPPLDLVFSPEPDEYQFPTFAAYAEALRKHPSSINVVPLIGHSTLRCGTMDDVDRPATDSEITAMKESLRESLKAGAAGFSTGLFYAPNKPAPAAEVAAIASELSAFKGIYATHMRNEGEGLFDSLDETFDTARRAGCAVVISHHKCQNDKVWGRSAESLARIEAASAEQPVGFDVYPYVAGSTVLLEEMIQPSKRIIVSWSAAVPEAGGRDLSDISAEWGCSDAEAMARLQPGGGIYFSMDEADVDRILSHPMGMIGSDGIPHDVHPHPRLWGTFPRVLGHYARERGLFSLEEGVRKMTGLSAQTFNLKDRGLLQVGAFADVVVFDANTIIDTATFETPKSTAAGIDTVLVNGAIAWQQGAGTGQRSGRVLSNPGVT
ncbi:MAG: D-aminoacylase [Gammaproteobacteria bacterium]|mgnify:FL=1|nr:D-aminoacylase [Gammaproteobacteria bacterium]